MANANVTLESLPKAVLEKIWLLSGNPQLPLASIILASQLRSAHIKREFYQAFVPRVLQVSLTPAMAHRMLKMVGITPYVASKTLEHAEITKENVNTIWQDAFWSSFKFQMGGTEYGTDEWNTKSSRFINLVKTHLRIYVPYGTIIPPALLEYADIRRC